VTSRVVRDIRHTYDIYEKHMYSETYLTINGNHRGIAGTFNVSAFVGIPEEFQEHICQIPLSQPDFLFLVLVIWSLTCLAEVKASKYVRLLHSEHPTVPKYDAVNVS